MTSDRVLGTDDLATSWITDPQHRRFLAQDAAAQFRFFQASLRDGPGFHTLDFAGQPLPSDVQELHTTTRLVHSYALGMLAGVAGAERMVDHGMSYLWSHHRDAQHGGYLWALDEDGVHDGRKLAYGHVFVLLAGASAKMAGHPEADRLIEDAFQVLDSHFWEARRGLFQDELTRDWTPFSDYRGMNANMHGIEALLTAHEATGAEEFLDRAGRILEFFTGRMAPEYNWRLPEHYTRDWQVDPEYAGNPMFRPAGTTPGHSFELARLLLQHWDLRGRPDDGAPDRARKLFDRAVSDAWDSDRGGFVYTLKFDGSWDNTNRYWWPVTEAIGTAAAFVKLAPNADDETLYRRLWRFSADHLVDHQAGGWFPELAADNGKAATQFAGKPDIYHSIQAALFPPVPRLSRIAEALPEAQG
ncbi:MAG: AGE family epimerase/isomerase [Rhodobacteraceae bacterium]|nr:MAG: AGE family epimerase/isomerase [Paracoccaceae bacterium]